MNRLINKRRNIGSPLNENGLPKAIFGAIIGGVASLASGALGASSAKKQQQKAQEIQQAQFDQQLKNQKQQLDLQHQQFEYTKDTQEDAIAKQNVINNQQMQEQGNANALAQQAENTKKLAGFDTAGVMRDFNVFRKGGIVPPTNTLVQQDKTRVATDIPQVVNTTNMGDGSSGLFVEPKKETVTPPVKKKVVTAPAKKEIVKPSEKKVEVKEEPKINPIAVASYGDITGNKYFTRGEDLTRGRDIAEGSTKNSDNREVRKGNEKSSYDKVNHAHDYHNAWIGSEKAAGILAQYGISPEQYKQNLADTEITLFEPDNAAPQLLFFNGKSRSYNGRFTPNKYVQKKAAKLANIEGNNTWKHLLTKDPNGQKGRYVYTTPKAYLHETAHAYSAIPDGEGGFTINEGQTKAINNVLAKSDKDLSKVMSYYKSPQEIQARTAVMRKELHEQGINVNEMHDIKDPKFKKALENSKQNKNVQDLMRMFNDEQLTELLNTVVSTNNGRGKTIARMGGAINAGGQLDIMNQGGKVPLSSTGGEFVGAKHEQGGIEVAYQGNPVAEVEGGEGEHTVHGNPFISSDYLLNPLSGKTFAEDMIKLEKKKGKFEKLMSERPGDFRLKNAIDREQSKIDRLAMLQEQLKQSL